MLWSASNHLNDLFPLLRSSLSNARTLNQNLAAHLENPDFEKQLEGWEIHLIAEAARNFEITLKAELNIAPAYLVTPKGGYNVDILTLAPSQAFHPDLLTLVPEAKYDVEQAAKCMAFEVPTAAGFHLHRINESVVHHYWDAVANGAQRPKARNLGIYLTAMNDKGIGEKKVLATLTQIKDLHRNPLIHPQDSLTTQEAIELFGIIGSVVSSMVSTIQSYHEQRVKIVEPSLSQALVALAS